MEYEGTTYRPPPEADTLLLQVTVGCSHNKCSFCAMYRDVSFRTVNMAQIENDLKEAKFIRGSVDRVFLVNGDAFVLSANKLKAIAQKVKATFPDCTTISMYASIRNIIPKSDIELKELRECGINDLYIGIESGSDNVQKLLNKGNTIEEAVTQLARLDKVGMSHISLLMLGSAGRNRGLDNAKLTAEFLNTTQPKMVWAGTLAVFEGTELYSDVEKGRFELASELEVLEEEKELLRLISLSNTRFYVVHPTNTVPVSGILPDDRQAMIDKIDQVIRTTGKEALSNSFIRSTL